MLLHVWLVLFTLAVVSTGFTITKRLPATIGTLATIAMFTVVAFGALQLEVVTNGSVITRDPNQPLAFLGLAGIVLNLVFLFADATGQLPKGGPDSGREMERDVR